MLKRMEYNYYPRYTCMCKDVSAVPRASSTEKRSQRGRIVISVEKIVREVGVDRPAVKRRHYGYTYPIWN